MESYYLVIFSPEMFGQMLISQIVAARTFLAVEDWAFANTPEGYYVATIEKNYDSPMGAVQVDLRKV